MKKPPSARTDDGQSITLTKRNLMSDTTTHSQAPHDPVEPSRIDKRADQANVIDGTIYVTQAIPNEGAYITIAGRGDDIKIVAFDLEDLKLITEIAQELGVTA